MRTLGLLAPTALLLSCAGPLAQPSPPPSSVDASSAPALHGSAAPSSAAALHGSAAPSSAAALHGSPAERSIPTTSAALPPEVEALRPVAAQLLEATRASRGGYDRLAELTDRIGPRLSGSPELERAVAWGVASLRAAGLESARAEPVMVPKWVRGVERGAIVAPTRHTLALLALGGSVATPRGGLRAPVLVVDSLEALEARGREVAGHIVVFNKAMPAYAHGESGYGDLLPIRGLGASRASQLGAKAALIRSLTATSLRTPHTGATRFEPGVRPIPAAAISIEDAELIARLARAGRVELQLELGAKMMGEAPSANVVAELVGRERPQEIVLLGAHLDSWDVGTGAHDDGAGCAAVIEALAAMRRLGLQPKRTVRAVLFTNEENGLRGAAAYAKAHAAERHVAAIEMDGGGFAARGFNVDTPQPTAPVIARLAPIARLLDPIGAGAVMEGYSGADIHALASTGAVLLGLEVEGSKYFDYHHSHADTLDKVRPEDLASDAGALAVMAYALAELGLEPGPHQR